MKVFVQRGCWRGIWCCLECEMSICLILINPFVILDSTKQEQEAPRRLYKQLPTSLSSLGSVVALQPQSAVVLQPPQLNLSLLQMTLQKLQLLLQGEMMESRHSGILSTVFASETW